jgi:hypothetical protein
MVARLRPRREPGLNAAILIPALCLLALLPPARAGEPIDLIPEGSLLCWYARPLPSVVGPPRDGATLATWVTLGSRLVGRPLEGEPLLWMRLLETLGRLTHHPYAIALIDAHAVPVGSADGRRLDRMRMALVVDPEGDSAWFLQAIQKIVNEQTDAGTAVILNRTVNGRAFQELQDQRLPYWAHIAWGKVDDLFLVTLGAGAWPELAELAEPDSPALSRVGWFGKVHQERRPETRIEIFAAFDRIRDRLDPLVNGRATEFFREWGAERTDFTHWAVGFEGKGLFCVARFLGEGREVKRLYADPSYATGRLAAAIPAGATYAAFKAPTGLAISNFFGSLVATRSDKVQANVMAEWERIQRDRKFNGQRDVLAHLGQHMVIHNDPPHPLHIPLAMTVLIQIAEQPNEVAGAAERFCEGWRDALVGLGSEGAPNILSLRRSDDGVWNLQIGPIAGPAWTVTDRYLITSWSPTALRTYLSHVGEAAGSIIIPH